MVARVRNAKGCRIRFRRTFSLAETVEWSNLCRVFNLHPFGQGNDVVSWALEVSGEYSTRSILLAICPRGNNKVVFIISLCL
jgi:hypothetical protein